MVFIHCKCFFVVPERTPILFFYLQSFLPKNPVFVTQIAKICNKVTIIFSNSTDRKRHFINQKLSICGMVLSICGVLFGEQRFISPKLADSYDIAAKPIYTLSYNGIVVGLRDTKIPCNTIL
jgi:hypothetical protein